MKITPLQAELLGEQAVCMLCDEVEKQTGIKLGVEKVKTQVLNKDGKWVDFPPEKIRFFI